jgi:hypothetical protein
VAGERPSRAICVAGEDELLVCVRRTDPIRRISRTQTARPELPFVVPVLNRAGDRTTILDVRKPRRAGVRECGGPA